jgi:hypothetical protein
MKQRNTVALTTSRNEWADNNFNRSGKSRFGNLMPFNEALLDERFSPAESLHHDIFLASIARCHDLHLPASESATVVPDPPVARRDGAIRE